MKRTSIYGIASVFLVAAMAALGLAAFPSQPEQLEFEEARMFIEYNFSGNDLGFHIFLDGEDWTDLKIYDPTGTKIADVSARGGYSRLGLTELFFEGAEPNLAEFPLAELLALFPEGEYTFTGKTVDNEKIVATATLTHNVPDAPTVSTQTAACGNTINITWTPVTGPAAILPGGNVDVVAYQVIVGSFQVTVPENVTSVTVPEQFYQSLEPGVHDFEVLAIDVSGNQTIREGAFVKP
jgi:hypothetical protein